MPPKKLPVQKAKKTPTKRKLQMKSQKPPRFSNEELNEEINTFLTIYNPYMSVNCVEFDKKSHVFKQVFDYKKPVTLYKKIGAVKQRLTGRYGIVYEEVDEIGEEKMENKFNFCSMETQTDLFISKDHEAFIDPGMSPVLKFQATASKEEIVKAYQENESKKKKEDDRWIKGNIKTWLKLIGRKELQLNERNRSYLRLCERMLDQNKSEANLDFTFFDNPNDEFNPDVGTLLPLWTLTCKTAMKGMIVSSLCWNPLHQDLIAAGFRMPEVDPEENEDEDDLLLIRERGCVCVYSLKGPSYPHKIFHCASGVCCLEFHPILCHLLAVAFSGGNVAVYDLKREEESAKGQDTKFLRNFHCDKVSEIKWLPDQLPQKFCSVSYDGKIINWNFLLNDLFSLEIVTSLSIKNWKIEAPPKGLEMAIECKKQLGDNMILNSSGTAISLNPQIVDLFLVGSETGLIHKYSFDDKVCISTYEDHKNYVQSVHWNPYHSNVFLSCSKDYTVQVCDHTSRKSVFEFFFEYEVIDVAWAPFSSTLFAAISGNARINVFDLAMNRSEAVGTFDVYETKQGIWLTKIAFHPKKPVVIVGDDRGYVTILKLSPNLRSSLKAVETVEYSKFVTAEIEKMDKLLTSAKVSGKS